MKTIVVTKCPMCNRYKTTDGGWDWLDTIEQLVLEIKRHRLEIILQKCDECERRK